MEIPNSINISSQQIEVIGLTNPFTFERKRITIENRTSLYNIAIKLLNGNRPSNDFFIFINDVKIDFPFWKYTYPKPGSIVTVRAAPTGGDTGRLVAVLAIATAAAFIGPAAAGYAGASASAGGLGLSAGVAGLLGAGAGAATMAVGMLAVNAFIPIPEGKFAKETESAVLSITGARNVEKPFSPVPQVLGFFQYTPPLSASSYVTTNGDNQDLTLLMTAGYGPLDISNFKIGNDPIENFSNYTIEINNGWANDDDITVYPGLTEQKIIDIRLWHGEWRQSGDPPHPEPNPTPPTYYVYATNAVCYKFAIDVIFPYGLIRIKDQGDRQSMSVTLRVEYRVQGDTDWILHDDIVYSEQTNTMVRRTIEVSPNLINDEEKIFEVRMSRLTLDDREGRDPDGDNTRYSSCYWKYLTGFSNEDPISGPVESSCLTEIALNIRASNQLSGNIENFSCLCKTICLDYDSSSGDWIMRETNNPASLFRHVLQGKANKNPVPDCRIDLEGIANFHSFCRYSEFKFNAVRDFSSTVIDTLRDVAAAGRGRPAIINGKWTVIYESEDTTLVQLFTPRNSWGFSASKQFIDVPHGFSVRYVDGEDDYNQTEKIFYDSANGYKETNSTIFESVEFPGLTTEYENECMAKYELLMANQRQEVFTWKCDVEHIACTQGDIVGFTHDAIKTCTGSGRVIAFSNIDKTITLDTEVYVPTNATAAHRTNSDFNAIQYRDLITSDQTTNVLEYAVMPGDIEIGNLISVGERDEVKFELLISEIKPKRDLSATIVAYKAISNFPCVGGG